MKTTTILFIGSAAAKFYLVVLSILLVNIAFTQSITNVSPKLEGQIIAVTYNLQSDNPVDISLFISEDGGKTFTGPLKHVSGDIGLIQSGTNKKILWDVLKERKILHGNNIVFRVKAEPSKYDIMTDSRDGKTYKTVKIGNQTWMAENLNYSTNSGSWCYYNSTANCNKYGRLYDWETAKTVCPPGWKLPSKSDFETLLSNVGDSGSNAYNTLILDGNSGFSALLGGWRRYDGNFNSIDSYGYFWSSSSDGSGGAWYLGISSYDKNAYVNSYTRSLGFSVRCLQE